MNQRRALVICAGLLAIGAQASPRSQAAPATAAAASGGDRARSDIEAAIWTILLPKKSATELDLDVLANGIAQLGAEAIAPAVSILLGEGAEPDTEHQPDARAIEKRWEILTKGLARLPGRAVVDELSSRVTPGASVDQRLFVMRAMAAIGGGEGLERALKIAAALDPIQWQRTFVQESIEDSLARLATGDVQRVDRLGQALHAADPRFAPTLARALCRTRSRAALPALVRALGRDAELDASMLREVGEMVGRGLAEIDASDLLRVRSLVTDDDPRVQRASAAALARIGDDECVEELSALLASPDAVTSTTAHQCLKMLTRQDLPPDRAAWTSWLEKETEWLEQEFPRIETAMASESTGELATVTIEALAHPLFRHRVARALRPLLDSENVELRRFACGTLAQVGSPLAASWLVDALDDDDEALRKDACSSLRRLTGLDLQADAGAWRRALGL